MKKRLLDILYFIIGLILIAVIYIILAAWKDETYFLPHLNDIFSAFFKLLGKSETYLGILNTIKNLLLSLIVSFVIAIILAVIAYRFKIIYKILRPIMQISRFIPIIIIISLLYFIIFGHNYLIYFISVGSILIPIIYESIYKALGAIPKEYIDVYKMNSKLTPYIIWKVYIPLIMPTIKSSIINAIGLGIKISLSVEFIVHINDTLGILIYKKINSYEGYTDIFAYILVLIIVSLILEAIPYIISLIYNKIKHQEEE